MTDRSHEADSQHALLRKEEVAERLRVPIGTLNHWVQTGQGPRSARIGRRRFWRAADVDAWVAAQFEEQNR